MIRRLLTFARRLVGLVAVAAAAWWSIEAVMTWWAFRYLGHKVVDDTGTPVGIRIVPLTPAETAAARAAEPEIYAAAWAELHADA